MKVLRAVMLASVCALTTGVTSAPLVDMERSNTNVIVTPAPPTEPDIAAQVEPNTTAVDLTIDGTTEG